MVKKGDPIDWKTAIVTNVQILQQREKVDLNHVWEYHLPEVRATLQQVKDVERQLGFEFPEDYRDFLLHANGWKCFYQYVDILPLCDLLNTSDIRNEIMQNLELMLQYKPFEGKWYNINDVLPIAASTHDIDVFVLIKPGNIDEGKIIWFAGGEIDSFSSFYEFYFSMLEYNWRAVDRLKEEFEENRGKNE